MGYDHIQIPPVYRQVCIICIIQEKYSVHEVCNRIQVVNVATYFYFGLSLIGSQELDTDAAQMFFPIILVLKFVFFIGWLKVGQCSHCCLFSPIVDQVADAIAHPFGEDEDDFQIGELISRHIWVGIKYIEEEF